MSLIDLIFLTMFIWLPFLAAFPFLIGMPDNIVNTFLIGTGSGVVSLFIVIVISFICRLRSGERFKRKLRVWAVLSVLMSVTGALYYRMHH
jgi:hypothetical protein